MQTRFRNVRAVKQMNSTIDSPSCAQSPSHPSFEFWFCNKNSTPRPINFAFKLSFAKSFLCFISLLLLELNFPGRSRLCKARGVKKCFIHYLFSQPIVRKFLPKEIEFCVHTLTPIRCQLPAWQCVRNALRGGLGNARESIHFSTAICIIKNHFPVMTMMEEWRRTRKEMLCGVEWRMFCLNGWFPEEKEKLPGEKFITMGRKISKEFPCFWKNFFLGEIES